MKIHYLGHSEFVVEMKNNEWKSVKILCDTWLSDYAFWDMMMRNPKIEIDYSKLDIDAIFISHSHCDHFDPYTLVEIYKNIIPRPLILLPETLSFIVPLLNEYLPKQKIQILKNRQAFNLNGIDIEGIVFENNYITNEDDVMTLAISNDRELLYTDVDTVPPENEESIELLYNLFTSKNFEQALYMSTRNELAGNMRIIEAKTSPERKQIASEYKEQRKEEIEYNYARFDEDFIESSDIQDLPYFMKAVNGQGIMHHDPEFLKLRILKLDEEADIERSFAKKYKKNFPITHFIPGKTHVIEKRKFEISGDVPFLKSCEYLDPKTDLDTKIFRNINDVTLWFWPLSQRNGNYKAQEQKILDALNHKFLPYRLANTEDPLKNAILQAKNRKYAIKIKYGNSEEFFERNYYYDFTSTQFQLEKWAHTGFQEDYWANDIDDFLEGHQELYSNFWHTLTPGKAYRFWTCLWANFLNNDILLKKYKFHFKRASIEKNVESFVVPLIKWRK